MRNLKLHNKILLIISVGILIFGVLLAGIIRVALSKQLLSVLKERGTQVVKDVSRQGINYILLDDLLGLQTFINGYIRGDSDIIYIYIKDAKNKVLAHTFKEGFPLILKEADIAPLGQIYDHSVKPLILEGESILDISAPIFKGELGAAHAGISEKALNKVVGNTIKLVGAIMIVVLVVCGLASVFLSRLIIEPVLGLVKIAKAVSQGDLNCRADVKSSDEIGELAQVFNKMIDSLKATTVSRGYLDKVINSMMNVLIVIGNDGKINDINNSALDLLGYKKEEIIGLPIDTIIFGEDTGIILKEMRVNPPAYNKEKIYLSKSGKKIPVIFSASSISSPANSTQGVICVAQDITKHKLLEQRLTRINDCLLDFKVDPEQNIKSLVSVCAEVLGANCAFYYSINDGVVCSQKQWEIPADFNISKDGKGHIYYDIVQQGLDAVVVCNDLPQTPYQQTDQNVMRYNLKAYMGRVVKLAGEVMGSLSVFYQNDVVITKEDKRVLGTMCAAIATEERRKKAEKELKDSYDSLKSVQSQLLQKDKMANMGQLAGSVAHEINNPLTGVLNNAQLIKMMFEANQYIEPEELKELLSVIEESALRCKKITESLLDFSHASIGEFQRLSLNGVIEKVTGLIYTEMKLQNINIKKELQPGIADIEGDPQLLQQIIANLISNAKWAIEKRFGKTGGGLVTIKSEADSENKHIYLYLIDNGIGIPEDKIGEIFEPFFTTKQVGVGTGLGLSLVSGIIRKHKGSIEVQSKVNEGTTFKITFPVSQA